MAIFGDKNAKAGGDQPAPVEKHGSPSTIHPSFDEMQKGWQKVTSTRSSVGDGMLVGDEKSAKDALNRTPREGEGGSERELSIAGDLVHRAGKAANGDQTAIKEMKDKIAGLDKESAGRVIDEANHDLPPNLRLAQTKNGEIWLGKKEGAEYVPKAQLK